MKEKELTQNPYAKNYNENSLFDKIKGAAQKAGISIIYNVLVLFFTLQKEETPMWAKGIIIGALGYFILPIDAIPDIAVGVGYIDDAGAIASALGMVAMYIDDEAKNQAKQKLTDWFGDFSDSDLQEKQ